MSKVTEILDDTQAKYGYGRIANEKAEQAINAYIAEVIGNDEREVLEGTNLTYNRNIVKNELRAEQRQRAGL